MNMLQFRRAIAISVSIAALSTTLVVTQAPAVGAQERDPATALAGLEAQVLSTGPGGETPTSPSEVVLTDEEIAQVKDMKAPRPRSSCTTAATTGPPRRSPA